MEIDWLLLTKYLAGECSDKEEQKVVAWLKEDQENRLKFQSIKEIWSIEPSGDINISEEKAWETFHEKRFKPKFSEKVGANKAQAFNGSQILKRRYNWSRFFTAAAVVLISFFIYLFYPAESDQDNLLVENEPSKVINTEMGERSSVRLSDGTIVYLNANSTLEISNLYGDSLRSVRLTGEAFFNVIGNKETPFTVQSEGFKTRVVGTRFNVTAYPCSSDISTCQQEVQVVVEEGEVELGMADENRGNPIRAYQMGRLGASGQTIVEDVSDLESYISWKDGRLVFDSTSFDEVVMRLENWYNIEIQVGPSLKSRQLTASFKNEPLPQVLDVVALSLDAEYKIKGRKVKFRAKQ